MYNSVSSLLLRSGLWGKGAWGYNKQDARAARRTQGTQTPLPWGSRLGWAAMPKWWQHVCTGSFLESLSISARRLAATAAPLFPRFSTLARAGLLTCRGPASLLPMRLWRCTVDAPFGGCYDCRTVPYRLGSQQRDCSGFAPDSLLAWQTVVSACDPSSGQFSLSLALQK